MKQTALSHTSVGLAVAGALAALAPIDGLAQEMVTLKAVTAWSRNFTFNDQYFEWIKRVNGEPASRICTGR